MEAQKEFPNLQWKMCDECFSMWAWTTPNDTVNVWGTKEESLVIPKGTPIEVCPRCCKMNN